MAGGDEVIELQLIKATKMKWQKEIDGKTGGSIFIYVQSETQPLQKHSELVFTLERWAKQTFQPSLCFLNTAQGALFI